MCGGKRDQQASRGLRVVSQRHQFGGARHDRGVHRHADRTFGCVSHARSARVSNNADRPKPPQRPVIIRQQPRVFLRHLNGRRYEIAVSAKVPFWRKRALLQQRRQGAWKTGKSVVLTEQNAVGTQGVVWTSAQFKATIPRGAALAAALITAAPA